MSNRISQHQPKYEQGIFEFQEIARVENDELNIATEQKQKVLLNQFVLTADSDGISMFEKLYGITPEDTDTLEFRRERVLARVQLQPPYTERFLRQQLDRLLGDGQYTLIIDWENYIIYLNYQSPSSSIKKEISIILDKVKPANMVFVTEPLLTYTLAENEVISNTPTIFYNLGTTWILGKRPFRDNGVTEVFKVASTNSITDNLLNDTANFVLSEIGKVIVNNSVEITTFTKKQVSGHVVELEYEVKNSQGINTITRLQICKTDGTVLTDVTVYVPVVQQSVINHKIQVKEGA